MKEFGGGVEVVGLKAVSPLYICDREQWQYAQTAAKVVLTGGFDGSLRGDAAAAYRQSRERRSPAAPAPTGGGAMREFAELPGSQWMESR